MFLCERLNAHKSYCQILLQINYTVSASSNECSLYKTPLGRLVIYIGYNKLKNKIKLAAEKNFLKRP